ncbi:MAG TPA: pyridoxamine 5'-phosphate oxidase family protein [Clostridiales bacterium]|nr:pyridoxamine 5'-phosphate oxidase family protein [Clostridiales bacterium]
MDRQKFMNILDEILDDSNAGVLSTIDQNRNIYTRWMTPVLLRGRIGVIFSVTSSNSNKVKQIQQHPEVTWMIQTRALDQIITIHGKASVLNEPSLTAEVLETVGDKLTMFWRINEDLKDFVVLETVIEKGVYYEPMKGLHYTVDFK